MDAGQASDGNGEKRRSAFPSDRVRMVMATASADGLTTGAKEKRISGRVGEKLHEAARRRSGLEGNALLEYAYAKVALEDDFASALFELEGSVSRDVDLEF